MTHRAEVKPGLSATLWTVHNRRFRMGRLAPAGRAAVSENTASFSEQLRRWRTAASLSQEDLAARSGLSVRGISDLERGARQAPRLETVRLLADALGLAGNDRAMLLAAARPQGL